MILVIPVTPPCVQAGVKELQVWLSQPNFIGGEDIYFKKMEPVQVSSCHPKEG